MGLLEVKLPFSQRWELLFIDVLKWLCIFIVYLFMNGSRKQMSADIFFASIILGITAFHFIVFELFEFYFTEY